MSDVDDHWLLPIAERITRAHEVAQAAGLVVQEYQGSAAVQIVKTIEGNDVLLHLQSDRSPARLPLMVGESIHHLRAALDNLVVLLADKSAGNRLPATKTKHLQFPITESPQGFAKSLPRLTGLHADYIKRIEEVQPYHLLTYALGEAAAITPDREPLVELRELSNHDKHRRVHLVLHRASGLEVHHDGGTPAPEIQLSQDILNNGDLIARVSNAKPDQVHATVELMLQHPINGLPLRLEALLNRLIWMLSTEVCPASRTWQGFLCLKGGDRRVGDS